MLRTESRRVFTGLRKMRRGLLSWEVVDLIDGFGLLNLPESFARGASSAIVEGFSD